jgi:hypothetical protein
MNYVLIIIVIQFYGPAITSVPFNTANACLDTRDDLRKKDSSIRVSCYSTGNFGVKGGVVER